VLRTGEAWIGKRMYKWPYHVSVRAGEVWIGEQDVQMALSCKCRELEKYGLGNRMYKWPYHVSTENWRNMDWATECTNGLYYVSAENWRSMDRQEDVQMALSCKCRELEKYG
jgi:hypothetical protein